MTRHKPCRFAPSWVCALLLNLFATAALAHDARPIYVAIAEESPNVFRVQGKVPATVPDHAVPAVAMPAQCHPSESSRRWQAGDAHQFLALYRCDTGLQGAVIALRYPDINPSLSALLRLDLANGVSLSQILAPGENRWLVPAQPSKVAIAKQYTFYGIEHIFSGFDHLLFVACLLFIARTPRKILLTVTGFTLAHSLTLALATLEIVTPPVAPVEAAIALSIVFLAHEIAVGNTRSWTWRYPVLVSATFGLLHGFGFAALLKDLGLPAGDIGLALLFFNLGVEVGQLVFVAGISLLALASVGLTGMQGRDFLDRRTPALAGSYLIGTLGALWLIERVAAFAPILPK